MSETRIIISENEYLKGKTLCKSENSQIEFVKKEFFVPVKKIVLPKDFSKTEAAFFIPENHINGGMII